MRKRDDVAASRLFERYSPIFEGDTKIIQKLYKRDFGRKYIYDYVAKIVSQSRDRKLREEVVGALGMQEKTALMRTIGESVERYCGSLIRSESLIRATHSEVRARSIDPRNIILFKPTQYQHSFQYKNFKDNLKINWILGMLPNKTPILVPAFATFLWYDKYSNEFNYPVSSVGLAAHTSLEKAILHATFELIERDAAMISWYDRLELPQLDLHDCRLSSLSRLVRNIRKEGLNLNVLITTLDLGVPSVIAYTTNPGNWPYASFGTAAGSDLELTCLKALEESMMVRQSLESLPKSKIFESTPRFSRIKTFLDHAKLYGVESMKSAFEFFEMGEILSIKQAKAKFDFRKVTDLASATYLLGKEGLKWIAVDLTTPKVSLIGFKTARVIIPELQQIDFDYNARFLGGPRLASVPRKLQMEKKANTLPHPFS